MSYSKVQVLRKRRTTLNIANNWFKNSNLNCLGCLFLPEVLGNLIFNYVKTCFSWDNSFLKEGIKLDNDDSIVDLSSHVKQCTVRSTDNYIFHESKNTIIELIYHDIAPQFYGYRNIFNCYGVSFHFI